MVNVFSMGSDTENKWGLHQETTKDQEGLRPPPCPSVSSVVKSLLRSRIQRRRRVLRQFFPRTVGALDLQFAKQD